jgi:hypothetical protein
MRADWQDENRTWRPASPPREAAGGAYARVADAEDASLDRFDELVTMIGQIDRLPDLAEDIRNWRPLPLSRGTGAPFGRADALAPVARHAFDAVVAGLNRLSAAAVALCENAEGRLSGDEIAACREIGVVMGRLLGRARALIETAGGPSFGAARAGVDRPFPRNEAG